MNYAGIKYCDIANGSGCRTVLFVSGCRNACKGCFQPQTWDFCYGKPFDEAVQQEVNAAGDKLTVYQIPRKVTTNRPTGAEALKTDASKRVFWLSNKLNGKTMLYMKKFDGIADPDHDTTDVTDSDAALDNCIGEYVTGFTVAKSTSDAKVTITLELKQGKQKYSITNEFKLRNALQ